MNWGLESKSKRKSCLCSNPSIDFGACPQFIHTLIDLAYKGSRLFFNLLVYLNDRVLDFMEENPVLQAILAAIRNLKFGTLEIVVHDSRVVRIERRERIRLDVDSGSADDDLKSPTAA